MKFYILTINNESIMKQKHAISKRVGWRLGDFFFSDETPVNETISLIIIDVCLNGLTKHINKSTCRQSNIIDLTYKNGTYIVTYDYYDEDKINQESVLDVTDYIIEYGTRL